MIKYRIHHYTLIEVLVYLCVFAVVSGLAIMLFGKGFSNNKGFRENAEDILRISRVGDQWRDDVRKAVKVEARDGEMTLLSAGGKSISYRLRNHDLQRQTKRGAWKTLMERVKRCEFVKTAYDGFDAWTMNVELRTKKKNPKVKPLFSFISVNKEKTDKIGAL